MIDYFLEYKSNNFKLVIENYFDFEVQAALDLVTDPYHQISSSPTLMSWEAELRKAGFLVQLFDRKSDHTFLNIGDNHFMLLLPGFTKPVLIKVNLLEKTIKGVASFGSVEPLIEYFKKMDVKKKMNSTFE